METETLSQVPVETTVEVQPISNQPQLVSKDNIIQIGLLESFFAILPVIAVACIAWGKLNKGVEKIEETLKDDIKPEVKKISGLEVRISGLEEKTLTLERQINALWKDSLAPASSPRKLNDRGIDILEKSGIKKIVDDKKNDLLNIVKEKNFTTAYDAEREIERVMNELPQHFPDIMASLKKGAFKTGADINAVLFVGSIYLRDEIFKDIGFSLTDLDK
jgi:hypothetical protein